MKTDTPTINTDERWKKLFQTTFLDPVQEPSAQEALKKTNKIPDANDFVKTKNVAMFGYMSHLVQTWEEQFKGIDWDFVSFPTFKEMPGVGSQSYPSYFGITKMAKNKEAAMEVLKYMASDEFQTELARKGLIPVLKDQAVLQQLGKESPFKDKNWKSVFHNKFAPIPALSPIEGELAGVYTSYATKAQIGTVDLNTALRQAEEDAKKKIAEYKQRK
jgi:multiple sugar transport system substrate-binding protein